MNTSILPTQTVNEHPEEEDEDEIIEKINKKEVKLKSLEEQLNKKHQQQTGKDNFQIGIVVVGFVGSFLVGGLLKTAIFSYFS